MSKKHEVEKLEKDEVVDKVNKIDELEIFTRPISELKQSDTFKNLFPRNPKVLEQIEKDMRENGFEIAYPLITWKDIVVDGNCRLELAKKLGITEVWVVDYTWETEKEALEYAFHCQRDRRNMTDAEIFLLVEKHDQRKTPGRKPDSDKLASPEANIGKSAVKTAATIGTSATKVEKSRTILQSGKTELIEEVKSGKKSINQGSQEVAASKRAKAKGKRKDGPDYKGAIKALSQAIKCCDSDKDLAEAITKVIGQVNSKMKEKSGDTAKDK